MADEQYRWLDRETADRLLGGESLEAVDPADRDQAERLAKTLEALTAEPALSSAELPGEAAALAAFRAARAGRDPASATVGHSSASGASEVSDAPGAGPVDVGLVRIGGADNGVCRPRRPRWARPVRLGLAAALAVGMVGGVAVAAGTGVLTSPFVGDEGGRPAATVSAPAPPERPLFSPSPEGGVRGGPTPDDDSQAPTDPGTTEGAEPGGPAPDRGSAPGRDKAARGWWKVVTAYCRDLRDGKELSSDRRRALESAAGGSERVRKYCRGVLGAVGDGTWGKSGSGKDGDRDRDRERDRNRDRDSDDDEGDRAGSGGDGWGGRDGDDDRDHHGHRGRDRDGGRDGHRTQGAVAATSTVVARTAALLPGRALTSVTSR
ncbi:hypothetical protein OG331_19975 [Streptomyces sp. NBC_01017]|uniref:hypothetical protein n=1 Tax=Streptomyces sp. NBC_01017 TaxID=2903721 RepID=UPI00386A937D|nr:hypothetical protein OG331_19975 [Streptomyces sp. NBC_01017]